jgi:predicted MFS family arabinose efflux permease
VSTPDPPRRASRALDALNFFLADVRTGLGPYLAVYLLTVRDWNEAEIGVVMSVAGIAGILAQTPSGALVDAFKSTRLLVIGAASIVTLGSLLLPALSTFWPVLISQAVVHASGSLFGPAVAAISLGIVGHAHLARRIGRNEALNHAGNACAAAVAAAGALVWGPSVVFVLLAVMAVATLASTAMIPAAQSTTPARVVWPMALTMSTSNPRSFELSSPAGRF